MAFMVTNFRGMISRACAPLAMACAVLMLAAGSASAAQPLPWQLGLQPPAGSIAEMADDLHNLLLVVITHLRRRICECATACARQSGGGSSSRSGLSRSL